MNNNKLNSMQYSLEAVPPGALKDLNSSINKNSEYFSGNPNSSYNNNLINKNPYDVRQFDIDGGPSEENSIVRNDGSVDQQQYQAWLAQQN